MLGYGSSLDAFAVTDPDPAGRGAVACMRQAIRSAGLEPQHIDCVNAHATGTPKNDAVETAAIKEVLGRTGLRNPRPCGEVDDGTFDRGQRGGGGGGRGAVHRPADGPADDQPRSSDPACDLDYVPGTARPFHGDIVLSNSFGFGGQNATVVFGRFPPSDQMSSAIASR